MNQEWIDLLLSLPLNREQRNIVNKKNKYSVMSSTDFNSIAKILINHDMTDKAIEVLQQGIKKHPNLISLRFHLAEIFLEKGLVTSAWSLIENISNVKSMTTKQLHIVYALSVLKGYEANARNIALKIIKSENNEEYKQAALLLQHEGFRCVQNRFSKQYLGRTIDLKNSTVIDLQSKITDSLNWEMCSVDEVFGDWYSSKRQSGTCFEMLSDAEILANQGFYQSAIEKVRSSWKKSPNDSRFANMINQWPGNKKSPEQKMSKTEQVLLADYKINRLKTLLVKLNECVEQNTSG